MPANVQMPGGFGVATHEVYNQPGDLVGYDPYNDDVALKAAVTAFGGDWAKDRI